MPLSIVLQILFIIFGPYLCIGLSKKLPGQWLSPIVLAYATGIVLANIQLLDINHSVSTLFSQATVVLAIPMLLYATDLKGWILQARSVILSFFLCVCSGIASSIAIAWLWKDQFENAWQLSGMLVGVYTGGTPNMQAIGLTLGVDEEMFVLMNAADIFCGGIYLLFSYLCGPLCGRLVSPCI